MMINTMGLLTGLTVFLLSGCTGSVTHGLPADLGPITSGNAHQVVQLFKIEPGKDSCGYMYFTLSPDGKTLAVGGADGVCLYDLRQPGESPLQLQGHTLSTYDLEFSPDGNYLAWGNHDGTVRIWDIQAGREHALLSGHSGPMDCVAFSLDGETLASGSRDTTIRLWDVASGTLKGILRHWGTLSLTFSGWQVFQKSGGGDPLM
jgi:WD40 repeat protein